jgi:hypothetical protein
MENSTRGNSGQDNRDHQNQQQDPNSKASTTNQESRNSGPDKDRCHPENDRNSRPENQSIHNTSSDNKNYNNPNRIENQTPEERENIAESSNETKKENKDKNDKNKYDME